jgi:signal transduction histidine kinase
MEFGSFSQSSVRRRTVEWREENDRLQETIAKRMTATEKVLPQDSAAEALRQKEEFFAIMSYEILTPMSELVSTVSLLFDGPLDTVQSAHATTIQRCAQDLMTLHHDMHEFMAGPKQEIGAGGRQ